LIRFIEEIPNGGAGRQTALRQHLEPKRGFVRLLQRNVDARDEFWTRPRPARRSIICANAGARATELAPNVSVFVDRRQRPDESQDVQSELLRPCFERFGFWIHPDPSCRGDAEGDASRRVSWTANESNHQSINIQQSAINNLAAHG
jgi:hypothetical protein